MYAIITLFKAVQIISLSESTQQYISLFKYLMLMLFKTTEDDK